MTEKFDIVLEAEITKTAKLFSIPRIEAIYILENQARNDVRIAEARLKYFVEAGWVEKEKYIY